MYEQLPYLYSNLISSLMLHDFLFCWICILTRDPFSPIHLHPPFVAQFEPHSFGRFDILDLVDEKFCCKIQIKQIH